MRSAKRFRGSNDKIIKAKKKAEVVSAMRAEDDEPLAVVCSCIHLSHNAPVARSVENNWYAVMESKLSELDAIAKKYRVPIVCCGDVFDRPDAPPELISFAIEHLPHMYSIPGQHDLPHHNYDDLHKSAYWTLVKAGKIINLEPGKINRVDTSRYSFYVNAFPWGFEGDIEEWEDDSDFTICIAHAYIWKSEKTSYPGAPPSKHVEEWTGKFKGYNAVAMGDNHRGFLYNDLDSPAIFNAGTLLRRKADEINYKPRVGIVYRSGKIEQYFLETEDDKFIDMDGACAIIEKALDATDFLEELSTIGGKIVDFAEAVERFCERNDISKRIKSILSKSMESKK